MRRFYLRATAADGSQALITLVDAVVPLALLELQDGASYQTVRAALTPENALKLAAALTEWASIYTPADAE